MANLNKMTKAALQDELLATHGEKAPSKWTKLELKARINELRGDEEVLPTSGSTLQDRTRDLRKAAKKKSELIEFCRNIPVDLNGNETMAVMESRALRRLQETCAAGPLDYVGFGKYSHLQYINILTSYEEYRRWTKQMYKEDPEGNSTDPRLRRLARWLLDNEDKTGYPNKKEPGQVKKGTLGKVSPNPAHEPGQSSTSSAPMGTPTDPRLETMLQEQNKRMDQMANVIELLRSELTASRGERPRKGAERKIENDDQQEEDAYMTEGSYSMVSTAGTQKSVGK